jgi:hypothetical protein
VFTTSSTDPSRAESQPPAATEFDITFPAGTKINQTVVPFCKNLDESSNPPCPKNTQIGTGTAEAALAFSIGGSNKIPAKVTAYNRKGGLWLYVVPQRISTSPVVLKPTFSKLTLKTKVAPLCAAGVCANLSKFQLATKPFKKGTKIFFQTPSKCTKAGWKFKAHIEYESSSNEPPKNITSTQKCK